MSKGKLERTTGGFVVTAFPLQTVYQGTGVVFTGDYQVSVNTSQSEYPHGICLDPSTSGALQETVPVLVPGPVLNVLVGSGGWTAGQLVAPSVSAGDGSWIVDTSDPVGIAVTSGVASQYADVIYTGFQL